MPSLTVGETQNESQSFHIGHSSVSFQCFCSELTLVLSLERPSAANYMSAINPRTHSLLQIPMYLCDQNTDREQTAESWWAASQASPSSAVPEANLHRASSFRTLLHSVPINMDKLQDTSGLNM